MQAQELALELSLDPTSVHGNSIRRGKHQGETLAGPKPLPSNLRFKSSSPSFPDELMFTFTGTTKKITAVIVNAWASLTRKVYGSGLLAFHAFCNARNISEAEHAPVKSITLASFIATMAGLYSGKTICNYVYGVRAWHILHGSPWIINEPEILALLTVSVTLTPISSKRAPHQPFTIEHICEVRKVLDLTKPLDAAFFACLTTTFYTASRLGEFTIPSINQFDSNRHATIDGVSEVTNRNGFRVKAFILPITKTEKEPMSVSWVTQQGLSDPEEGWLNHIKINNPDSSDHAQNLPHFSGHSLRIGATLEYLLRGVPFEVMKAKGRWKSNAFLIYLRRYAQILAPYIQDKPSLHAAFVHLTSQEAPINNPLLPSR
ncbi:hypothetical protein SERLADRAFT_374499 [Serpula lacrymans var. lacrymans S7.9]|uniref:Tyr recombinase domain-containing protein n=1 Tax=Serpula lacrymans var. lacrymans (strain S7.9) TaxID=578457 RepID=F8PC20_SERL9|nr:uncharacterized protein SERLADRAFT_374499 [Serpula lacrymans var. lacrymans S7.9]EGO19220.1 hypothetical protein SERLADRAFT_374499 [Serpula lacrymans var. lacrymans S7.9]